MMISSTQNFVSINFLNTVVTIFVLSTFQLTATMNHNRTRDHGDGKERRLLKGPVSAFEYSHDDNENDNDVGDGDEKDLFFLSAPGTHSSIKRYRSQRRWKRFFSLLGASVIITMLLFLFALQIYYHLPRSSSSRPRRNRSNQHEWDALLDAAFNQNRSFVPKYHCLFVSFVCSRSFFKNVLIFFLLFKMSPNLK